MTGAIQILRLPARSEVATGDTWDLGRLFADDAAWRAGLDQLEGRIAGYDEFRGRLAEGAERLAACLAYDSDTERLAERVGSYAYLRSSEDQTNDAAQQMLARFQNIATRVEEAASFIRPEVLGLSDSVIAAYLAHAALAPYRLLLERLVRFKPYTLGPSEERLLAMQGEMAGTANQVFRQLHDADLKFGLVTNEQGQRVELSPATFVQLLESPARRVRRTAFFQFYRQFAAHQHTLAAALAGSVHRDVYVARARGYPSCLSAALFSDNVPDAVYDNLIATVRRHLPTVHRFYQLRRRRMRLRDIHHYDTYVPILSQLTRHHTWDQAVEVVAESLRPLGDEYVKVLQSGLTARWCDRYPNQGKQSGAFSYGTYDGDPHIMMNYKPEVLGDVFTLAHEAGHSMHSFLSAKYQPFEYYNYSIFVAEVASTFNEQLLAHYLLEHASDDAWRAYLINNQIDDIRSTIVRQTMFAEFERTTHTMAEEGQPLTVQSLRGEYRRLLDDYFGPGFVIDDELSLECLRIPHFYRAFYVYKYATGMSAAIALAQRVLGGGAREVDDYLNFLRGGCSKYPLELLSDAGVDLRTPAPIDAAMQQLARLVDELEDLLPRS